MSIRHLITAVAIAIAFSLAAAGAQELLPADQISNWAAPPYWMPLKAVAVEGDGEDQPGIQPQAVAGVPTSALAFTGITPCRIADTRGNGFTGAYGPPALAAGSPRNFPLTGQCGIPGGAEAVSLNVTVTNTLGPGFILIYPQGGAAPGVSTLNYVASQTVANAAVVPLGTGGGVTVVAGVSGTDLILDTNGYYAPQTVVNTVNGLSGAVTLAQGTNVTITPAGQTLTIAAPNVDATTLGGQPASFYDLAPPPPAGNSLTPLDTTGSVSDEFTSVTIGADGLGLISYHDATNADLKVAHCSNTACSSATITPLDTAGDVGSESSVTIGADGLGLISYYDLTNGDLKVAHCSNVNCTSATITTLEGSGNVGRYTSVTIGADGLGLISYRDAGNVDLKVAHCSNTLCTSATITPLDTAGTVGEYTSVTIGADGLGLISYRDFTNTALKVAHCSDVTCSTATFATLDNTGGDIGSYTSVTIGADGLGLISYTDSTNFDLRVAHCSNVTCSSATITTLDSTDVVGFYTSVTVGADGLGLISYFDSTNGDLKVAHCSNVNCTMATITPLDTTGSVGYYTSVTIGADGLGLISYYDFTNLDLKVAHCSNVLCSPYFRRR